MDKENLFYIVVTGTNNRAQTEMKEPLIVRRAWVDDVMAPLIDGFEAITVDAYERIFTEQDME